MPLLFKCNYSLRTLPELPLLPLFYRNVLSACESISKHTARTKNEIEDEIWWNNHEVTIGGNMMLAQRRLARHPRQGRKVLDVYGIQGVVQNSHKLSVLYWLV